MMKKLFITIFIFTVFFTSIYAQKNESKDGKFSINTTFTNQLLWRSRPTTNAPTIIPCVEYTTNGLIVGVWGAYSIDQSYKEVDFYLGYKSDFIDFMVYDYYNPSVSIPQKFGNFKQGETEHVFEATTVVRPIKNSSLRLRGAVIFGGHDWKTKLNPVSLELDYEQRYSSYFEVAYDFKIGSVTVSPEIGLTPAEGLYADNFSVFNYGINVKKDLKINDHFTIPTSYMLTYNATLEQIFFSVAFTLSN